MSKAKLKALKGLSNRLPKSYVLRRHGIVRDLSDLHKANDEGADLELPELTEGNAGDKYKIKRQVLEPVNHYRRLKRAFSKRGTQGVREYIIWLKHNNDKLSRQFSDIEPVPDGLLQIARSKSGNFWEGLLAFLYAFLRSFTNKENA